MNNEYFLCKSSVDIYYHMKVWTNMEANRRRQFQMHAPVNWVTISSDNGLSSVWCKARADPGLEVRGGAKWGGGGGDIPFYFFIEYIYCIQAKPFSYAVLPWRPVTKNKYIDIRDTYIHNHKYKSYIKTTISWQIAIRLRYEYIGLVVSNKIIA